MPWTVTNSFKRGLMKTYGRPVRRAHDENVYHASKKRRVEAVDNAEDAESNLRYAIRESSIAVAVSSPSRRNSVIFSEATQEEIDDLSTPPSSPPPRLTPPPANTRKPTFSFLKRKKSYNSIKEPTNGSTALTEVNSNSVRSGTDQPNKKTQQPPAVLKQLQIDAGITVRRSCNTCGMEYVPSNAEDSDLHDKFHSMNAVGIDLGKAFVKANASRWVYEAARCDEGYVVIVDRKASPAARNQAKKVLDVVNRELSSPAIDDTTLWSQIEPPKRFRKNGKKEETDRYKVFLHMKDSKCMGLCLAERIWEAQPVKLDGGAANGNTSNEDHRSSSISVLNTFDPAIVGVSRIWTCGSARRRGIAMDLLDCVISNFIYGLDIPKEQIAFTQPTESGIRLSECFFGVGEPWHVYNENPHVP